MEVRKKLLTFSVQDIKLALELSDVAEVIDVQNLKKSPKAKPYVIIPYRESLVFLIDCIKKFGSGRTVSSEDKLQAIVLGPDETVGLLIEPPISIVEFSKDQIVPVPKIIAEAIDTRYTSEIATESEDILLILDKDALFPEEEIGRIKKIKEQLCYAR